MDHWIEGHSTETVIYQDKDCFMDMETKNVKSSIWSLLEKIGKLLQHEER